MTQFPLFIILELELEVQKILKKICTATIRLRKLELESNQISHVRLELSL